MPSERVSKTKSIDKRPKRQKHRTYPASKVGNKTLLLVFCSLLFLLVYLLDYAFSDEVEYTASIRAVEGGYELIYPMQTVTVTHGAYKHNDKVYVAPSGSVTDKKHGVKMVVASIEQSDDCDILHLDFAVEGVPSFLTTKEYTQLAARSRSASQGRIVRYVNIEGRHVFGKLLIRSLNFEY